MFNLAKTKMPTAEEALPGRSEKMLVPEQHFVSGRPLQPPFPSEMETVLFGLGCFWGAERKFWQISDVYTTAVGYAGGYTSNPSYKEVCSGLTGHNEVVLVVFAPSQIEFTSLLGIFWEAHDPTQGMGQGNDRGTQYRSGIYTTTDAQFSAANASRSAYQNAVTKAGHGKITTEILPAPTFYYAEDYHQQYLAKNPNGYCGLGGVGVPFSEPA